MMSAFKVLARFKFLRGTPFDIFGYSGERRDRAQADRGLQATLEEILAKLTPDNHPLAVGLAAIPEKILAASVSVKARHLAAAKADEAALLEQFLFRQAAPAEGRRIARYRSPTSTLCPSARSRCCGAIRFIASRSTA